MQQLHSLQEQEPLWSSESSLGLCVLQPHQLFLRRISFFYPKLIFTLRAESRIRLNASFVHQTEEKNGSVRSEDLKKTQKSAAGLLPWLRCSGEWWFNVLMDRKEVDKRGDSHDFTSNLPELSLTLQRKRNKIPFFSDSCILVSLRGGALWRRGFHTEGWAAYYK